MVLIIQLLEETQDFVKALFADYFIYTARTDNKAQTDLGQHIVDASKVVKGKMPILNTRTR